MPKFGAEDKQGDQHGNVGKNSAHTSTRQGVSLYEIARRTGLSRNKVRNWLRMPEEVQTPIYSRTTGFSKHSGFVAEWEQSLKDDSLRPKKDGRTVRALFVQIQASGYTGGYPRVTEYIRA